MTYQAHPSERIGHDTDKAAFLRVLADQLKPDSLLSDPEDVCPYECDGLSAYRTLPWIVALPETLEQAQAVLRLCHQHGVPVVARGAGTGLSGGALPTDNGVLLSLAKFDRILHLDPINRTARVQPGVRNAAVSEAANPFGLYYAPDPSSQIACTIGGNIAENAGGVHCLKYGLTVHNLIGLKLLTVEGELIELGSGGLDGPGYDLLALMTGSEGLLGVIVEATLKLLPLAATAKTLLAAFGTVEQAGAAVAEIIGAGLVPAGLEMMDNLIIRATEDFIHAGYPVDAAAIILCEMDGMAEQVESELTQAKDILMRMGATEVRQALTETERKKFWAGRKAAFPAVGRISPDYYCMDGTIPRHRLAEVLHRIAELLGGVIERFFIAHELEHVAKLEAQIGQRREDKIAPTYTGDGDAVEVIEAEFTHRFAEQAFVGEHHAAVGDPAGSFHEILCAHAADDLYGHRLGQLRDR